MKEVKISVLNLQNNCYVAVPSAHRKYLIFLSNTAFKENKVIVSMIKLMTENDKEISMPMEQWLSFVDHIYNFDIKGELSHSEINDHVSMGSFIHHTAKTGARQKVVKEEKQAITRKASIENPEIRKLNERQGRAAVGASESTFTYYIVFYFALFNAYTTMYHNTQTGSTQENLTMLNYITETATDAAVELYNAAIETRLPNLLSMNAGTKLWWGLIDVFFRTPYYYAKGAGMHIFKWREADQNKGDFMAVIKGEQYHESYEKYAEDFKLLAKIPREQIFKLLDGEYLYEQYKDDMEMEERIVKAMNRLTEVFDINESVQGIGEFGVTKKYDGELANGRNMSPLFSYAQIVNNFDINTFVTNIVLTFGNLVTGNFREGEAMWGDSAENRIIRKKTLITMGLLTGYVLFPGIYIVGSYTNSFAKGRERMMNELNARKKEEGAAYDLRRRYKGWREGILDMYEYSMYTMLIYTATMELVGISNIVGKNMALDTFISESYSSEWYYITQLATIKMYQWHRNRNGLGYRNPDMYIKNIALPCITTMALEFVIAVTTKNSVDSFIMDTLGYDIDAFGTGMEKITTTLTIFSVIALHVGNYLYRSPYQTSTIIDDNLIETHANLIRNEKTRDYAKVMRHKLKHNKRFMKAAMSHISII